MKKENIFLFAIILILFAVDSSAVVINEFVIDTQSDWNSDGAANSNDKWIELYNPATGSINLNNWNLNLSGEIKSISGTIPANGYLTFFFSELQNGRIELYDSSNNSIDSVTYSESSSDSYDECFARFPNGIDTNNPTDFIKTLCTFNSLNNFSFTPITITNLEVQPSCALDTDEIIIRAEITGSISEVKLVINETEIIFPETSEGIYSYTLDSSETSPGILEWQFSVLDTKGNTTLGEISSSRIYSTTSLNIFPQFPDGKNGWYISQPQFELVNPDAAHIYYRWGGSGFDYTFPFGLEGTPNNGNITGGAQVLYYNSDVCSEPEKQFLGKFDFTDPQIKNLFPISVTYNQNVSVSAHIDEFYHGNSGVNLSSVAMEIDGEEVPISLKLSGSDADVFFYGNIPNGLHEAKVYAEDNSGRNSSASWQFELVSPVDFNMSINLPDQEIFTGRKVQFNITLTREAKKLSYINYNDANPTFKKLCSDCDSFGNNQSRFKSLREGENNLVFRAESNGDVIEKNVFLIIDSKAPEIASTLPKSGLASGNFEITFNEENPSSLKLHYGNSQIHEVNEINISSCQKNGKYFCSAQVGLSEFDGTQIEYYFELADIAGNVAESQPRILSVDISPPVINSFESGIKGKFVEFTLDITESYLSEVTYIDSGKEYRLCISLQDGICQKKVSFSDGSHDVKIVVRDKAGNTAEAFAEFLIDSKQPKIKSTGPEKGFASGKFTSVFEEENPNEMYLNYGDSEKRFSRLNLSDCVPDRKSFVCAVFVNLSDFEGEEITYSFNLTDLAGNFVESRPVSLKVDSAPPEVANFDYTIMERNVQFRMEVEDANFDEVVYLDRTELNPKFKTLCSKLEGSSCEKIIKFVRGPHLVDIVAKDKAGNEAVVAQNLEFSI